MQRKKRKKKNRADHHALAQVLGVVLGILGVLVLVSLLTHGVAGSNAAGWIGAVIAGFLFTTVGYGAYMIAASFFLLAWNRIRLEPIENTTRIIARGLIFTAICCVTFAVPSAGEAPRALVLGGWFGVGIAKWILVPLLGKIGATLVVFVALILWLFFAIDIEGIANAVERSPILQNEILRALQWLGVGKSQAHATSEATEDEETGEAPGTLSLIDAPYEAPDISGLKKRKLGTAEVTEDPKGAEQLTSCLKQFDIDGRVERSMRGPVVTRFEIALPSGVRVNSITRLADDLALSLKAPRVRILAPIPGKAAVGIEIPRKKADIVHLGTLLSSDVFQQTSHALPIVLGRAVDGTPVCENLAEMPHLLVAGATGSGKSVGIHAMLASLMFRYGPVDLRLLLIDPKMVELSCYEDIPHLVAPVVTEPKRAAEALLWATEEMDRRYEILSQMRMRSIAEYQKIPSDKNLSPMPYVVIVIDELADLMMTASKDVEISLARLAQKARAVGMHLIVATQRPSVNVITGVIKANFSSRIAFRVASKTDSRTILDANGAEHLLGKGDMLYLAAGREPVRVHGAFVSPRESKRLIRSILRQKIPCKYVCWGSLGR